MLPKFNFASLLMMDVSVAYFYFSVKMDQGKEKIFSGCTSYMKYQCFTSMKSKTKSK